MSITIILIFISLSALSAQEVSDDFIDYSISDSNSDSTDISNDNYYDDFNFKDLSDNKIDSQNTIENDNSSIVTKDDKDIKTAANSTTKKITPTVRMSDYTIYRNQTVTFYARIMDENVTGNAIFKINDITVSDLLPVQNGIVSSDFLVPVTWGVPTHTLTFVYAGNEKFNQVKVNSTLTLEYDSDRIDADVKTQNYNVKYNKTVQLKVTLNSSATGKVAFKVKRKTVAVVNVGNGVATYNYDTSGVIPGTYRLSVVYSGDYRFAEKRLDSNLTISKLNSKIITKDVTSKAGSATLFEAVVIDEDGNYVQNVPVSFKINRGTVGNNTTDENGTAVLEIPLDYKLEDSKYNLTVSSGTTKTIIGNRTVVSLNLKQLKTKSTTTNVPAKPGDKVTLSTTVVDENNNPVLNGYVTYYINNKEYAKINVANGFARYHYTLRGDTDSLINITAKYTGTWKYASNQANGKITITKLATHTLAGNVLTKPGKISVFTANVSDEKQGPVNGGVVVFKLSGKIIGNSTVTNGKASYSYELPILNAGKYNLEANCLGSNIYKASSDMNVLNVSRLKTTTAGGPFTVTVGKSVLLKVTVYDESRYNVDNGTVKYYINNTYIGSSKVVKGSAVFNYTAPVKFEGKIVKYTANYTENGIYANSSYTGNLTITKQKDIYVSNSGNDKNIGNITHPFKTIKTALQHVSLLGTIHLNDGTYRESNLLINTSVQIAGSEPNKVIIDGQNSGKPIFNATIPAYSLELAGLTIKNGKSTLQASAGAVVSAGLLIARNTVFISNSATGTKSAGAIYSLGALRLTGVTFTNNTLTSSNAEGGAIRTINNNTTITHCWFNNNSVVGTATVGGAAIYSSNDYVTIINSTFNTNIATGKNVAGATIKTVNGSLGIYNTTFTSSQINSTNEAYGGTISTLSANTLIDNATFKNSKINSTNTASGGAIYAESSQIQLISTDFNSNTITSKNVLGGVMSVYNGLVSITKSKFEKNTASTTNDTAIAGAIYQNLGTMYLINSSFINNTAKGPTAYAGAIYFTGSTIKINYTSFNNNQANGVTMALSGALYSDASCEIFASNFTNNKVIANTVGGGAIASLGNIIVNKTNFISNNASNVGDAITGVKNIVDISNNYWGSTSPQWTKLLHGLSSPESYSKTKF